MVLAQPLARTRSTAPDQGTAERYHSFRRIQVLPYLARYTHRVAVSNRRLIACDEKGVTFKWKDYRMEGAERYKVMTLATDEFIRRFLMHVLPAGFHRIRYYGLLTSSKRAQNVARASELLLTPPPVIPIDAIKAINSSPCKPLTGELRGTHGPEPPTALYDGREVAAG